MQYITIFLALKIRPNVENIQQMCNSMRMVTKATRKRTSCEEWPRKVTFGRETVTAYRYDTPSGGFRYIVDNYASGKRRQDSYPTEAEALDAAQRLVTGSTFLSHLVC